MPRLTGPLCSFNASASIGKALTYRKKRGYTEASPYTKTHQPDTADQLTRKHNLQTADAFCARYLNTSASAFAWQKSATVSRYKAPGYHQAVANTAKAYAAASPASFVTSIAQEPNWAIVLTLQNVLDGAIGSEAGNFQLWTGPDPFHMTIHDEYPLIAGALWTDALGTEGETVYIQVTKNGLLRSGLYETTVVENPDVPLTVHDNVRIDGDLELVGAFTGNIGYVDRGDFNPVDFLTGAFTTDGVAHDLDLSGIIPLGARLAHLYIIYMDNNAFQQIYFYPVFSAQAQAHTWFSVQVGGIYQGSPLLLALDATRKITYKADNIAWNYIGLNVRGWWL